MPGLGWNRCAATCAACGLCVGACADTIRLLGDPDPIRDKKPDPQAPNSGTITSTIDWIEELYNVVFRVKSTKKDNTDTVPGPNGEPVNIPKKESVKRAFVGGPEREFQTFAFRELVCLRTQNTPDPIITGFPSSYALSNARLETPGGIFPMTITPVFDLDAPGQIPLMTTDLDGGVIEFEWDLSMITGSNRQGNFFLISGDVPISAVIPTPAAATPLMLGGLLLTARRRRR